MKLKVLQLNAWYGRTPDFHDLVSFLKKENADIMLFQEVYDGKDESTSPGFRLFSEFKKLFPHYDAVFEPAFCDITPYGNVQSGNAIFVRGKITGHKNIFFDVPYKIFKKRFWTRAGQHV